jgi:hypothetical protein
VGNEDGDANANGSKVCCLLLLHGKEVHGQHELCRQEHLQKDALDLGRSIAERVGHGERIRQQAVNDGGGSNGGNKLCWDDDSSRPVYSI